MEGSGAFARGLNREQAARYIGISPTKFDEMVKDGRMPKPIRIDARCVWDRWRVDECFDDLDGPRKEVNPWDEMLS